MTTFERRQRILDLLRSQSGVKVTLLAEQFEVSEGTIRNDLEALQAENKLKRVRGGAVPEASPFPHAARRIHGEAKKRIARWAADMVEDGDAILLDASSTVLYMATFLQEHRHLTIVTNGLEVARLLAENSSHTVILIGGIIGSNGAAVTGLMGLDILNGLHIRTAFVSGVGFSIETGLTESDLSEAKLKKQMRARASIVVALVDSSKLGKVGFVPVAGIHQIDRLFTDSNAPEAFIQQLRQAKVSVTVCGKRTVTSYKSEKATSYRIGFANLSESESAFAVDVRRGLERAAAQSSQVDLVLADNQLNAQQALRVADYLIEKEVDLVIEYQIDVHMNNLIMAKFKQAGIPVIAVDIPIVGATFFGVDNYFAGHLAGVALGQWIGENWNNRLEKLLILEEKRAGDLPAARIQGQLDGLEEIIGPVPLKNRIYLDSGNTSRRSYAEATQTLEQLPLRHIAVLPFNDDAALGALQAARHLERESSIVIVGQGADRLVRQEIRRRHSPIIGSTAYMPERYGEKLIKLARQLLRGEPVPPAVYIDHVFINAENIEEYYPNR